MGTQSCRNPVPVKNYPLRLSDVVQGIVLPYPLIGILLVYILQHPIYYSIHILAERDGT